MTIFPFFNDKLSYFWQQNILLIKTVSYNIFISSEKILGDEIGFLLGNF